MQKALSKLKKLKFGAQQTPEQLKQAFSRDYDVLKTPMTLCEGLEIITANQSGTKLLESMQLPMAGTLINQIIYNQQLTEKLFSDANENVSIEFRQRHFSVSSRRWKNSTSHWLLEWTDETIVNDLSAQLSEARSHDPSTGTLLPSKFSALLQSKLNTLTAGLFAHMKLGDGSLSNESLDDCVIELVDRINHAFGGDILISRCDNETLTFFIEVAAENDSESAHFLRQLNRIGSAILSPQKPTVAVASFPSNGKTEELLREAAILALKNASQSGSGTVFYPKLRTEAHKREQLANDMPHALANNEITPYFQPIIESETRKIKSFEALVRWIHPEFGYIIPPEIIEISQNINLLHSLTAHVLQQTIDQMIKWPSNVQFAVNITPDQLTGELVDLVRRSVRAAGIDPGRLEIEVTEDALIQHFEYSATIFSRLRSIGVTVAMDDFGAGYTSVGNLRTLDFDKIKIDKAISDGLPHDKKSVAIVKSLLYMAQELDLEVTVEGIEEQEQLDFLSSYDCGIQGFVFARPMPACDLPSMRKYLGKPSVIVNELRITMGNNRPIRRRIKSA